MKDLLYVIGHKNPDTDSICSALAYADLKRRIGERAIACRLGPLNEETKFILKKFELENPLLLKDARSQLRDIDLDKPCLIDEDASVYEAWNNIINSGNRSLFVLDKNKKMVGIVTTSNLSLTRVLKKDEIYSLMSKVDIETISRTINGNIVYKSLNFKTNGKVVIVTLSQDEDYKTMIENSVCILSDDIIKQKQLIKFGAKCLIITCGKEIDYEIIELAKAKDCSIITTQLDTMSVSTIINESFSIKEIMTKNILTFNEDEYIADVAKKMIKSRVRSYPVLDYEGNVIAAVSRYHLQNYRRKKFILVDHSERNQAINNIMEASIEEIIDHHHIGDIQTEKPIFYRNMRCGCTATIISILYQENGLLPDEKISGILLSAILSDTLNFKSATTTDLDRITAKWLAQRANITDIDEYAKEMLSASVSLSLTSPSELLNRDLKMYTMGKYKLAVSQTNYVNMKDVQKILPEFKKNMEKELNDKKVDLLIMMFTHVLAEGSLILYYGPISYIVNDIVETKFDENSGYDSEIISRKQQLIPKISMAINDI